MAVNDQSRPSWRKVRPDDPKRLAKLIEAAFELDSLRKDYEREAGAVGDEVKQIKALIIHDFEKSAIKEINTRLGTARFVTKEIPAVDEETGGWEAVYAYIVREAIENFSPPGQKAHTNKLAKYIAQHGYWDLIQKRFGERACQARWEENQKIPGVKQFTKADIKLGDAE